MYIQCPPKKLIKTGTHVPINDANKSIPSIGD